MFNDLWPSTRKRNSSFVPTPLTAKLSTSTTPEYPPRVTQDAQRKHIKQVSPPSSNVNDEPILGRLEHSQVDDGGDHPRGALPPAPSAQRRRREREGRQQPEASLTAQRKPESTRETPLPPPPPQQLQEETDQLRQQVEASLKAQRKPESVRETPPPPPRQLQEETDQLRQQVEASLKAQRKPESTRETPLPPPPPLQFQEEMDQLCQQIEASLDTQRKPESEPEWWGRLAKDLRSSILLDWEGEKDEASVRSHREREQENGDPGVAKNAMVDAFKEENEKLKTMLRRQTQQLDAAQERTKQERSHMQSEAETLKQELNAAREAYKREVGTMKVGLQKYGQRVEHLTADCERVWKDRESIRRNLNGEIERLKLAHAKEVEHLNAGREEVKQEHSKMQSEAEKLRGELNVAHEAHKEEVKRLKIGLQEYVQRVEHLSVDRERVRKDGEFIEQLKLAHAKETERFKTALEEANSDRTRAHSELREVRKSLDACISKQEERLREIEALRRELSNTKDLNANIDVETQRLKATHAKQIEQLDTIRREMKQERSRKQSEAEELSKELNAAHETHKREVDKLKMDLQEHVQRVEQMTVDRERVQKERESIKGNFSTEIERLKLAHAKETERFKAALEEVSLDRTQAHSELREVRKSLEAYTPKLDESLREMEALRRELSNTKDSNQMAGGLKQRLDIQSRELHSAREESSALRKEFNYLLTLENRSSDPESAQSLFRRSDAFSGAEVTTIIQRLNAEMLQSTAFMAESMTELFFHSTTMQAARTDEQLAACKRASGVIGGDIVHFLGTKKHKDDPILIQIAFQAYLTYRLRWIACAWIIGGDEKHNRFIDAIYQSVHEKEAEVVAGRWRAVTRAHVPSTLFNNSQTVLQIANGIIPNLSDILLTTGCNVQKSVISSALSSKFSDKLSFLVSLAMRVNKIMGEDVTSGDFEVTAVPPATAFDETEMEDSYDSGRSAKTKGSNDPKVLCATDLGLRKKTRVRMTGEKKWETKILLKPKVALESVVDILDE